MQIFNFNDFLLRYGVIYNQTPLFKITSISGLSEKGPWIAGGSLRRTLLKEPFDSDVDFFFASEEQLRNTRMILELNGFNLQKETEFNLTYIKGNEVAQLIKHRFYTSIFYILDSFDFTICQYGFDGASLYCGEYTLFDTARKKLVVNRITYGVASTRRLIKYTKQGYYACSGTIASLLSAVIENPNLIQGEISSID